MQNNTAHDSYQSYSISPIHLWHQYTSERVQSVFFVFFISLGENVAKKLKDLQDHMAWISAPSLLPLMCLMPMIYQFEFQPVRKEIMATPPNKAPGFEKVLMSVVKDCPRHITNIIKTGLFPYYKSSPRLPRKSRFVNLENIWKRQIASLFTKVATENSTQRRHSVSW